MLLAAGREVIAAVEPDAPSSGKTVLSVPVRSENMVSECAPNAVDLALGVGMPTEGPVAGLSVRRMLAERFRSRGYRFPALVHPSAAVSAHAMLDGGAQIMAGAVVQPGAIVGGFAIVNTRASVDHDCRLGEGCHIAPGATLGGNVQIGEETLVGIGSAVRQGIVVGRRVMIGGGAMVVRNIPDGECWTGVPARRRA
jgi:UDP-perosamine 4-acetyltransferase